jgi:hypothetical protein
MTNAETIRTLNDNDMAEYLAKVFYSELPMQQEFIRVCLEEWLAKPAN